MIKRWVEVKKHGEEWEGLKEWKDRDEWVGLQ